MSTGRNDPCPCGSGKKHKHCCLGKGDLATQARNRNFTIFAVVAVAAGVLSGMIVSTDIGILVGGVGLAVVAAAFWITAPPPTASGGGDPGAINFGR